MNGKISKKIRKAINKQVRYDLKEVTKIICEENIWERINYAFKIIFKYKIGEQLKVNRG